MSLYVLPAEGSAHVWRAALARDDARFEALLSTDERARAERFRFPEHRRRWVVSRAVLRSILAGYLADRPERLRFVAGPHGKPALQMGRTVHPLRFNATRSGDVALYAVALNREVGIDIELVRSDVDVLAVARRALRPPVVQSLEATDPAERQRAFFIAWVRHEAQQKCIGVGLAGDPKPSANALEVVNLELGAEYAAALASDGPLEDVVLRTMRLNHTHQ